ncbi:hypothetical protein ACHQM5_019568 [Ranunculus cassubicifolius]
MFSSLSLAKIVLHKRNFLPSLHIYPLSLIRFISSESKAHQNSFTVSYLINSCGLSQQKAISASKKIHFESPTKPNSVLTLLKNNGFSDSHISHIIAQRPTILVSSVDETLKPTFEFFNSKGLYGSELAKVLSREGVVLGRSLEKVIIPSFDFLKSIVGTDEKVIALLKRNTNALDKTKTIASNVALLRAHGVPMYNIQKLLVSQPRVLMLKVSRLSEIVKEVKEMEFDPLRYLFLLAVHVLSSMSKSSLEDKFDVFRSWGWSEDEVQCAFRKSPYCITLSEECIMVKMDYFVNKFGYAPSSIAEQPNILLYSCEKRIIPRCSAMQILFKNGQVEQPTTLFSFLHMQEDAFLKKYISRFEKEVPELLSTYQGKGKTG